MTQTGTVQPVKNGVLPNGREQQVEDPEEDLRCGYGGCTPGWLQCFTNPKAILAWLCWFSFIQGFVVNGINNVNTSTLERRFNLPSSKVGLVSSSYDIAAGLFVLPITYFGAHAHQPRMLAFAAFVLALGSFTMSLPHWASGLYELGESVADKCDILGNSTICEDSESNLSNYLYVLMLGQFFHGLGGTTLYSLGIVFLDANVKTKSSPLYQGILLGFSTLGPALGYVAGGQLLNIYVDFDVVDSDAIGISPEDPRWVGAWWVGFLAAGCLALTVVLLLAPYPKELPIAKVVRAERVSQVHQNGSEDVTSRANFGKSIKDFPVSCKLLVTNPVFVFATLGAVCEGITTSGMATFMPKFIQNQFSQTASWAALLGGFIAVPGAAGGNVVAGIVTKFLKLKVRGMLRMCILLTASCALLAPSFLVKCSLPAFAGINTQYGNGSSRLSAINLTASCNTQCHCTTLSYEPVCGSDGFQYFSPCYAACDSSVMVDGTQEFSNCSCVSGPGGGPPEVGMATAGTCDLSCSLMHVFLPLFFLIVFLTFMAGVPALCITLWCIPDNQKAFGLGFQWVFVRFLGMVPGPVLFGYVFDRTCLLWQDRCDEQGSCWVYDNQQLGINMTILAVCIKCLSTFFFFLAYTFYKPPSGTQLMKTQTFEALKDSTSEDIDKSEDIVFSGPVSNHVYTEDSPVHEQTGL